MVEASVTLNPPLQTDDQFDVCQLVSSFGSEPLLGASSEIRADHLNLATIQWLETAIQQTLAKWYPWEIHSHIKL